MGHKTYTGKQKMAGRVKDSVNYKKTPVNKSLVIFILSHLTGQVCINHILWNGQ